MTLVIPRGFETLRVDGRDGARSIASRGLDPGTGLRRGRWTPKQPPGSEAPDVATARRSAKGSAPPSARGWIQASEPGPAGEHEPRVTACRDAGLFFFPSVVPLVRGQLGD